MRWHIYVFSEIVATKQLLADFLKQWQYTPFQFLSKILCFIVLVYPRWYKPRSNTNFLVKNILLNGVKEYHGLMKKLEPTWPHIWVILCHCQSICIWTNVWLACLRQIKWYVNWCNRISWWNIPTGWFYNSFYFYSLCQLINSCKFGSMSWQIILRSVVVPIKIRQEKYLNKSILKYQRLLLKISRENVWHFWMILEVIGSSTTRLILNILWRKQGWVRNCCKIIR